MKNKNQKDAKAKPRAKVKKAASAPAPVKAPRALGISRERREIKTGLLVPAPWNPRGKVSPESVADLVASISTVGIIEPLVVMEAESGKEYIIIAGHRRAKAAELAKCETVPCDVLHGIDAATAKRMTFIENLQRRDADPILESNLVAELVTDGMTTDEIAAEIGRDRKWVLRRKNLSNLSPSWRKRVAKGEKITTDCLEHVAAFPEEIQEKLKKVWTEHSSVLRWIDIEGSFNRESLSLADAQFDTTPCKACSNNTGCTPDLFDWRGKPATLGKCMCEKCYKKKAAAHINEIIKQAESEGAQVIRHEPDYSVKTSPRRTKGCTVLYVYRPYYSDETKVEWGSLPKKKSGSGSAALSSEELAEKREKRERNKAIRALVTWCDTADNLAKLLLERFQDPVGGGIVPYAPFYVASAFVGIDSYHITGLSTEKTQSAIAAIFGTLRIPAGWAHTVAKQIISYLDPGRCQGYYAERNAKLVLAMFPSIRAEPGLGAELCDKILPQADVDAFTHPKISWDCEKSKEDSARPGDLTFIDDPLDDDEEEPPEDDD